MWPSIHHWQSALGEAVSSCATSESGLATLAAAGVAVRFDRRPVTVEEVACRCSTNWAARCS